MWHGAAPGGIQQPTNYVSVVAGDIVHVRAYGTNSSPNHLLSIRYTFTAANGQVYIYTFNGSENYPRC